MKILYTSWTRPRKKAYVKGEREMNKEFLLSKGFTEEQAENILKLYKEEIDGKYIAKHRFDEVNGELKTVKEQVTERDKQITDLKKFEGDNTALKTKITDLETSNTTKDTEYKTKFATEHKRNAVKLTLLEDDAGKPHDTDMVMGLFNMDQIVVDEVTGKITSGYKEQNDAIRKEKTFLFNSKVDPTKVPGWKPAGNPPIDGNKTPIADTAITYGKSLAQIKLGMMGVKPVEPITTTT